MSEQRQEKLLNKTKNWIRENVSARGGDFVDGGAPLDYVCTPNPNEVRMFEQWWEQNEKEIKNKYEEEIKNKWMEALPSPSYSDLKATLHCLHNQGLCHPETPTIGGEITGIIMDPIIELAWGVLHEVLCKLREM